MSGSFAKPGRQFPPDQTVHLSDIRDRGGFPGTDCPDRLIGDHNLFARRPVRHRARELTAYDFKGSPRFPLGERLTYADYGDQPGAPRRFGFGANERVLFAVVGSTFRVAYNNGARAAVLEHLGGDVARMGT